MKRSLHHTSYALDFSNTINDPIEIAGKEEEDLSKANELESSDSELSEYSLDEDSLVDALTITTPASPRSTFHLEEEEEEGVSIPLDLSFLNQVIPSVKSSVRRHSDSIVANACSTIDHFLSLDLVSLSTIQRNAFVFALSVIASASQAPNVKTFISEVHAQLSFVFSSIDQAAKFKVDIASQLGALKEKQEEYDHILLEKAQVNKKLLELGTAYEAQKAHIKVLVEELKQDEAKLISLVQEGIVYEALKAHIKVLAKELKGEEAKLFSLVQEGYIVKAQGQEYRQKAYSLGKFLGSQRGVAMKLTTEFQQAEASQRHYLKYWASLRCFNFSQL